MTITVFGGAFDDKTTKEYLETLEIGKMLGEKGYTVKNGGYRGIMEAVSKGVTENGGKAIGYTCATFKSTKGNDFLTEAYVSLDIYDRLRSLIEKTDLFIIQRGGFGTLAELFLTLDLARKREHKPKIILIGSFWKKIMSELEILFNPNEKELYLIIEDYKEIEEYL
jgi:uncharacterized protein (TIGR00730 family)